MIFGSGKTVSPPTQQKEIKESKQEVNYPPQPTLERRGSRSGPSSNITSSNINTSSFDSRSKPEAKLEQVPVTLKPTHAPTDKENFETELISTCLPTTLLTIVFRIPLGFVL
jgi:hypothetical protein